MKVGVDVAFLHRAPSGTGTYLRELLEAMATAESGVEIVPLAPDGLVRGVAERRRDRASWELVGAGRAARRAGVDLLHVPSFAAPVAGGPRLVVTVHDAIPFALDAYRSSRAMRVHLALLRRTVRRARIVLAPSRFAADEITRLLPYPRERIVVTPEAAGERFRPASSPIAIQASLRPIGVTSRYLFNVGGFDARKNLPLLLEAFADLIRDVDGPLQLVIAGAPHGTNPVIHPPLEPVIARLGLGQRVLLTGWVTEAEKVALYQGAAAYVTPSLHEGFGLTVLEAMACGTPVIAANRTSLPEVVGDCGLLVEPERAALVAAMRSVLTDDALDANLRTLGLARAASFTWRETARLTCDAYREALTRGGRRNG